MNKNFLILLVLSIALGSLVGDYFYKRNNSLKVFKEENNITFLQQGVYTNKSNMEKNTKRVDPKIVVYEDDKYYVYVGITNSNKNASKLKKIYNNKGIDIYEKELSVSNSEFLNNLEQFDLLMSKTTHDEELLSINEVILANYEETINNKQ